MPIDEEYLAGLGRFITEIETLPLSMRPRGTFGLGAIGAVPIGPRGLGAYGRNKLASRRANIYDPPDKPARSFEADYPQGAPSDATGNLTSDVDGRPLSATYVAGRSRLGGADMALPREALDEIAKARTGSPIRAVAPRSPEIGNDVGRAVFGRDGTADSVYISRALTEAQAPRVAAHEVAHLIDKAVFDIPIRGLNTELRKIYNDLNNPQGYGKAFGPEQNRYRGAAVERELMAEAIRAYMTNQNYTKTVAPRTAARIREFVNGHPMLRGLIQFNAVESAPASRIGLGFADDEEQPIP